MRRRGVRAVTITFCLCGLLAAGAAAQDAVPGPDLLKHLAGRWKAPEERIPKSSALDEQVFGAGAVDVRTVTLTISPSGEGDLQVRRSVVGKKGKVFAPSIMEVKMQIGEHVTRELGHLRPTVKVTSAEERYLDGDHERWTRDGTRLSLSLVDVTSKELNMQLDTPDGRGAFGATLTAATSGTDSRSRRQPS
jgi:hypothetical protein